ncbi:MAG TPA: Spo0E family sporulation regulatory protein-aspartic acid phosphatase [Candidatus Blautia intestinavium]|nr:Spo0E family sporulation regulatory protein-aspartic acid phosphatase [Candidatus Blautia intestinavium]
MWWKQKKKRRLYRRIERTRKKLNRMAGKNQNLGKCLKISRQLDEMMNQIQFE